MRSFLFALTLFVSSVAWAQSTNQDLLDPLGLALLKDYSSARVSSSNRFASSNDDSKRIMPGETLVMADLSGPGVVTHIWLTVAQNEFGWPRLLRLRVYYDGYKTPSVDAPLGDFFGVGHGSERNLNSIMVHDSSFGRARNSYWPIPFRKHCRITVTNEGERLVPMFYYHVDYRRYASLPPNTGYFHAYYRQERPARKGHNYEFVSIKGRGHYVGTVMSVVQTQLSWFGEGDDLFYIDGAKYPQLVGTGSEDYFNDAWGLRDSDGPWTGTPIAEGERLGSRLTGYRWHIPDPIAFNKSLWAGIEHAGWTANPDGSVRSGFEERPDYFSSVAFWYQEGVNEDLPEPPYGYERLPFGNATQLAIEDSINDVTTEKGQAAVQKEVDWSKDLLFLKAGGPGARINIPIDIPETGRYEIVGLIAQAPDYGNYVALMDGKPTNLDTRQPATSEVPFPGPEVFHNYLPEVYVARDRAIGMLDLSEGRHTLSFVCVGKDDGSAGYNLGINDVVLERVVDSPEQASTSFVPVPVGKPSNSPVYRGKPLSFYIGGLKNAAEPERERALYAIGEFGADGAPAIDVLVAALNDPSAKMRAAAASSLAKVGLPAAPSVPNLAKGLSDSSPRVRGLTAIALRAIGPKAEAAVPQLTTALNDPALPVRALAADALGAIGPQASAAAQALAQRLLAKGESRFVVNSILVALGNMGPAAREALPILRGGIETHQLGSGAERVILQIEGKEVPTYY